MKRRSVDRERIERADRESRIVLDAERQARDAKTAKLREQRLALATPAPAKRPLPMKKPARKVIEID